MNILSATALDKSIKDDEEKWVLTKNKIILFLIGVLGSTIVQ